MHTMHATTAISACRYVTSCVIISCVICRSVSHIYVDLVIHHLNHNHQHPSASLPTETQILLRLSKRCCSDPEHLSCTPQTWCASSNLVCTPNLVRISVRQKTHRARNPGPGTQPGAPRPLAHTPSHRRHTSNAHGTCGAATSAHASETPQALHTHNRRRGS